MWSYDLSSWLMSQNTLLYATVNMYQNKGCSFMGSPFLIKSFNSYSHISHISCWAYNLIAYTFQVTSHNKTLCVCLDHLRSLNDLITWLQSYAKTHYATTDQALFWIWCKFTTKVWVKYGMYCETCWELSADLKPYLRQRFYEQYDTLVKSLCNSIQIYRLMYTKWHFLNISTQLCTSYFNLYN